MKTVTNSENVTSSRKNNAMNYLRNIKVTRKNFGWWFLGLILLICFIGWVITWFNPDGNYFDPFIWMMNLFLRLVAGAPMEELGIEICASNMCFPIDWRLPVILRGLADGAVLTFVISVVSVFLGFFGGAILAVILVSKDPERENNTVRFIIIKIIKGIAQSYVDFFRSTPLLVQILLVHFGLPTMFPNFVSNFRSIGIPPEIISGIVALSLNTSAYQAEIIRGGILSIPTGQTEASRALGLSSIQTMQYVILPQAIRMILPPLTNELVNVILNSSLLSAVTVWELTLFARSLQSTFFLWTIFFIAAVFYFVITFSLSKLAKYIEIKYRIPGLGVAHD
jgi:His/Glu/Gln/Arg/opine family amino acid ABC transporter permease subunit